MKKNRNVSLVLSGGGARGIAHIGVIEELERRGYEIASIAGTSMGSVVGGVYALGRMEEFKQWIYTLDKKRVFSLVDFTLSKQGMVRGERVFKKMKQMIPDTNIEDLKIPYAAVAVDMLSKKEVVFRKGSLYDAMRASVSIPTVFTPVKMDHMLLVDGGVLNNIPIEHVKRSKGDLLVVVNVNANIPAVVPTFQKPEEIKKLSVYKRRTKEFYSHLQTISPKSEEEEDLGYFNLISRTLDLMTWRIDESILEKYEPDYLVEISRDSCTIWDFYKAEELVEMGRAAADLILSSKKRRDVKLSG